MATTFMCHVFACISCHPSTCFSNFEKSIFYCKYFHTVFWKELQWFITFSFAPQVSSSGTPGLHRDQIQSFHNLFAEVVVFCKKFARLNKYCQTNCKILAAAGSTEAGWVLNAKNTSFLQIFKN
jgi:hypothetical protein